MTSTSAKTVGPDLQPPPFSRINGVPDGAGRATGKISGTYLQWGCLTNDAFRSAWLANSWVWPAVDLLLVQTRRRQRSMRWPTTWKHIWTWSALLAECRAGCIMQH